MNKLWIALLPVAMLAQGRLTATFSDPNRPGTVRVTSIEGRIIVVGGPGKEVVIETNAKEGRPSEPQQGMRRIITGGQSLSVEEENNVIKIDGRHGGGTLRVQVPVKTSLVIRAINNGVTVENIEGDVDASSTNGSLILKGINGTVVANSTNGRVEAVLDGVTPDKPMSFLTLNGNVDVTLPATTKANLRMRAENGDVYSDFDIALKGDQMQTETEVRGTKRQWRSESFTFGTINGGGPEIRLESRNGKITIRRKQ